jgi:TonB family protein
VRLAAVVLGVAVAIAGVAAVEAPTTPPRLLTAELGSVPWDVRSGGIAAYDVRIDDEGAVAGAEMVQDVAPYGDQLRESLWSWHFEPALEEGRPVASRVLVLGFFRPPMLNFPAPENPRYKTTQAPADLPWPTSVAVPPYPPNALGNGQVILEVDVSEGGEVTATRVVSSPTPFDAAATEAARQWRFRPATRQGRDMAARVFMVFSFVATT